METTLNSAQALIGKKIFAEGWQYDNSGMISGCITEIKKSQFGNTIEVYVEPESNLSMDSFAFRANQIEVLLAEGRLPKANKFLNTGTNAWLI